MKVGQTVKRVILTAVFLAVFILGFKYLYSVFSWKDTSGDYFSCLEQLDEVEENTVDVAFFGPSAVYCAINPAVIWREAGITAYNAGISGMDSHAAPVFVREFLKKQSPKVVVLSTMLFTTDNYAVQGNIYRNTILLDTSREYVELVNRIAPDNDTTGGPIADYWLRWPILHGRYKELKKNDFVPVRSYKYALGYYNNDTVYYTPNLGSESLDTDICEPVSDYNKSFINELKDLADKNGFKLLFLNIPWAMSAQERAVVNGAYKYLEEIGIDYLDLNYLTEEMSLDFGIDFGDNVHARTVGATKISYYLGDYLIQNYDLKDHSDESGYEVYDLSYKLFEHQMLSKELSGLGEDDRFFRKIKKYDGLVLSITVNGLTSELSETATGLLLDYGMTAEQIASGGTYIFKDGKVLTEPSDRPYGYRINEDEYISIDVAPSDLGYHDNVYVGKTQYVFYTELGCKVVVYDEMLDEVIDSRIIE